MEVTKINSEIREAARENGVKLWQIARSLGINDGNFSRKLRREIQEPEKSKILKIIDDLSIKEGGGHAKNEAGS